MLIRALARLEKHESRPLICFHKYPVKYFFLTRLIAFFVLCINVPWGLINRLKKGNFNVDVTMDLKLLVHGGVF